jgi:ribonuclease P protein component
MGKLTFRKQERLSRDKFIQELFAQGSSFYLYPFKVFAMPHPDKAHPTHQVLISVSKKNFKRAVDRNLIRRRIREGYRLNKGGMPVQNKLLIAYIYSIKDILPSRQMHERLVKTFNRLEHVAEK